MENKNFLNARTQQKTDTSVNWAKAKNFIPLEGEIIVYSDLKQIKIGDGVTKVNELAFVSAEAENAPIIVTFTKDDSESLGVVGWTASPLLTDALASSRLILADCYSLGEYSSAEYVPLSSFGEDIYYFRTSNMWISINCTGEVSFSPLRGLGMNWYEDWDGVLANSARGEIFNDYTNNAAFGLYSHAEGSSTSSWGECSHAEGGSSQANGRCSHAEGMNTAAEGECSHAEGSDTYADGMASHAEGYITSALGQYSHAEGSDTVTYGYAAHSEGYHNIAEGDQSHAEGFFSCTNGKAAHAEGSNTNALADFTHSEGRGTIASQTAAHAEGSSTTASGPYSHSEGQETTASGWRAHSEGHTTTAAGDSSHAEGSNTNSSGDQSHAEGLYTESKGKASHAEGYGGIAQALESHVEGRSTRASGDQSHAEGYYARATGKASHAEGYLTQAVGQSSNAMGMKGMAYGGNSHIEGYSHKIPTFDINDIYYDGPESSEAFVEIAGTHDNNSNFIPTEETLTNWKNNRQSGNYGELYSLAGGNMSHAEGLDTLALGRAAHTEGNYTVAQGMAAHAEGSKTDANNFASHAEGEWSIAGNIGAHAENHKTKAYGAHSHTEGGSTETRGLYAHAEGEGTIAYAGQHAEGHYNAILEAKEIVATNYSKLDQGKDIDKLIVFTPGEFVATGENAHFIMHDISSDLPENLEGKAITMRRYMSGANQTTEYYLFTTDVITSKNDDESVIIGYEGTCEHHRIVTPNYTHIVGNGTDATNRANAHTLDAAGNAWFSGDVYVGAAGEGTAMADDGSMSYASKQKLITQGELEAALSGGSQGSGENSTIQGYEGNLADGDYSHAEGYKTAALGESAHAEGTNKANLDGAETYTTFTFITPYPELLPEGTDATVPLEITVNGPTATGVGSHAEGCSTLAFGYSAHAEGLYTLARGGRSHAEGTGSQAYGHQSHAEGGGTIAKGLCSHAEGESVGSCEILNKTDAALLDEWKSLDRDNKFSMALGRASHVDGKNNLSYGASTHAEGFATLAQGSVAHAEGRETQAIGNQSHAEGRNTQAIGSYTHAEGYYTIAEGNYQHVQGKFNEPLDANYLHVVGNGTSDTKRSNAHTLDKNGNAWFSGDVVATDKETGEEISLVGLSKASGSGNGQDPLVVSVIGQHESEQDCWNTDKGIYTTDFYKRAVYLSLETAWELCDKYGINRGLYPATRSFEEDTWFDLGAYRAHTTGNQCYIDISPNPDFVGKRPNSSSGEIFNDYTNNKATSNYAHAEGQETTASGIAAHAEGSVVVASGKSSHAEGSGTIAEARASHAEGDAISRSSVGGSRVGPQALGRASHAEGTGTVAGISGNADICASHAEGIGSQSLGAGSHAEGFDTAASGKGSHAEGSSGKTTSGSWTDDGSGDVEIPYQNLTGPKATGAGSHAEGIGTEAKGEAAHSEGMQTSASGNYSHAEGGPSVWRTTGGDADCYRHINGPKATGESAHAEGSGTVASGAYSHAEGWQTTASGSGSHAEGWQTIANGRYQHVSGAYNIPDERNQYACIVGNGTEEWYSDATHSYVGGPSNAYTLDWNGNGWFAGNVLAEKAVLATAFILQSPNGTKFQITVNDNGELSTVAI